jgi:multiple sugar transport system permease protein
MQVERNEPASIKLERLPRPAKTLAQRLEDSSSSVLLAPAIVLVLFLAVFPLIVSLFLSFARIKFIEGGFEIKFVGLDNYAKLLLGSEQRHLLGKFGSPTFIGWVAAMLFIAVMIYVIIRYITGPNFRLRGLISRAVIIILAAGIGWIAVITLGDNGLPGTLMVTLIFVFGGVFFQYMIGLGLALLLTQNLPGKRFFRVIFLLPMMITPVGVGFLFRMMTDTQIGPIAPVWRALGLVNFSWVSTPGGARIGVMIGDIWQWTPFMFIILLAALEGTSRDQIEAGLVDGANRLQMFRYIVLPQILPVSTTVILIRLIEAFKIIDMPNILTGGGPGTATESMTLHAYKAWRALDLGGSAAVAYLLLFLVTFISVLYVNVVRQRAVEAS